MRLGFITFAGILTLGAVPAIAQQTSICPAADIYFINGVFTSPDKAQAAADEIQTLVQARLKETGLDLLIPTECVRVRPSFNYTDGVADLWESVKQIFQARFERAFWRVYDELDTPSDEFVQSYAAVVITRTAAMLADPPELTKEQLDPFTATLNVQHKVIVIAHSQGNLYANTAFRRLFGRSSNTPRDDFETIALATPDSVVEGGGHWTTVVEDLLASGLFRTINATVKPPTTVNLLPFCIPLWTCHFVDHYVRGNLSGHRIADHVIGAMPLSIAPPVTHGTITIRATLDGQAWPGALNWSAIDTNLAIGAAAFGDHVPQTVSDVLQGHYQFSLIRDGPPGAILQAVTPSDVQILVGGGAITFTLAFASSHANVPPVAHFTMSAGTQSVSDGRTLIATADQASGEARVTFTDASSDPDGLGDIVSRLWTTNTGCTPSDPPPCVLSNGLSNFVYGFRPGGPYIVTLTVTDSANHVAASTGSIIVTPLVPTLQLVFDGSQNPRLSQAQFGDFSSKGINLMVGDSQSNLIMPAFYPAVSCGGGSCFTVISINPRLGTVNWEATDGIFVGFPYVGNRGNAFVSIGRNDEVYVEASPDQVLAYVNGVKQQFNWPYGLGVDATPNGSLFVGNLMTDLGSGFVYASVGPVIGTCCPVPSPPSYAAVLGGVTGAELFKLGQENETLAWARGPGDDPYLVSFAAYSQILDHVTRYDRYNLAQRCSVLLNIQSSAGPGTFSSRQSGVVGTSDGILLADQAGFVYRIDGSCQVTILAALPANLTFLQDKPNGQWGLGILGFNGGSNSLAAVRSSDGATWIQDAIRSPAVKVANQGNLLYVLAPPDYNSLNVATDLFVLDLDTGTILSQTDITAACRIVNLCGIIATPDGNVYVNDTGSTKIYKVNLTMTSPSPVVGPEQGNSKYDASHDRLSDRRKHRPSAR